MKAGKLQAKDIPNRPILELMATPGNWFTHRRTESDSFSRSLFDVLSPVDKLARAKMRQLIDRGLVSGCACGCRGDYEITDKGRAWLVEQPTK